MNRHYGGVIWTNHALQRLKERNIAQEDAWVAWRNPDTSRFSEDKAGWIYTKNWSDEAIEVVAKKNERGEWIIVSVWSNPRYSRYNKKHYTLIGQLYHFLRKFF